MAARRSRSGRATRSTGLRTENAEGTDRVVPGHSSRSLLRGLDHHREGRVHGDAVAGVADRHHLRAGLGEIGDQADVCVGGDVLARAVRELRGDREPGQQHRASGLELGGGRCTDSDVTASGGGTLTTASQAMRGLKAPLAGTSLTSTVWAESKVIVLVAGGKSPAVTSVDTVGASACPWSLKIVLRAVSWRNGL